MTSPDSLSLTQARRVALAAQGLAAPRPSGTPDRRQLRRVLSRTQLLQIDSIRVLERAHYVPIYSRLGAYPHRLVDDAAYSGKRELFEYWGHAASLLPVQLHPMLRWRMHHAADHVWDDVAALERKDPKLVQRIYDEVAARGPVSARDLETDAPRVKEHWGWNWSDSKKVLEWLFHCGRIAVSGRRSFERLYDLTERVLPAEVLAAPTPEVHTAKRELVARAAASLGVACEAELSDYFRLSVASTRAALAELREAGVVREVDVEGWDKPAYLHRDARVPRQGRARTLLSPFDPLVWHRDRTVRLWDFFYRIEIYVPRAKRVHGYYVLPFLLGDRLVARVDLKADRAAGALLVQAAWREPAADSRGDVAAELAAELWETASWLGLSDVVAPGNGDLAADLTAELKAAA